MLEEKNKAATSQPDPKGDGVEIYPLLMADLKARREMGIETYGTPLKSHNGRKALWDAYQECLDQAIYLRQAIFELYGE